MLLKGGIYAADFSTKLYAMEGEVKSGGGTTQWTISLLCKLTLQTL
jgi:hypothetical protein